MTPAGVRVPPGFRVAIDGPAGAGKSTLARRLSEELGLPYVNTGLMYRAVARQALTGGIDPDDGPTLRALAAGLSFSLGGAHIPSLLIDGVEAEGDPSLSTPEVEAVVSAVARHPEVREVLRARQRELGGDGGVMEGRDIGAVVMPDADVKIYLEAHPRVRAGRREQERDDRAAQAVARRDWLDALTNPLEPAPDAHLLDSSGLTREQVVAEALGVIAGALGVAGDDAAVLGHADAADLEHDAEPATRDSRDTAGRPARGATVAVVGRQNVGKSTLVNRLVGRKLAIADEMPGVTRDRLEIPVRWGRRSFVVVDTGGFIHRARGIESAVARQADIAAAQADVVLLVVDAQTGVQEEDATLARRLRRATVPVVVAANKVDSERQDALVGEFAALGLGEAMPISALHGRGSSELLDRVIELLPTDQDHSPVDDEMRFALMGRPNVGKSSLFNRLVNAERAVVHEAPGTTRDAVDSTLSLNGQVLRFIDTAGLRREVKTQGVEYYGLLRSRRALENAHVGVLVVDASEGLTSEDKRVGALVRQAGRGLVAVLNKWDLVPSEERAGLFVELGKALALFPGTPVLRTSALTGSGVKRIVPALLAVHGAWTRRVSTAEVNRELEAAMAANPPPRGVGRIRYATQVSSGPPTFVLFGSAIVPPAPYRRYLENTLRRAFGFDGVPVRLSFRTKERKGPGAADRSKARKATRYNR